MNLVKQRLRGVRFHYASDERSCGETIVEKIGKKKTEVACMRTAGHEGQHIAMAYAAARADGVCYGCRQKINGPHGHDEWSGACYASKNMVECACCYDRFPSISCIVSYKHGLNCAAAVLDDGRLVCWYGSYYQQDIYTFVDGVPVGFEMMNPICDGCIRTFLEQGALVRGWG